jgi:type IV pilus assembly protein PilW
MKSTSALIKTKGFSIIELMISITLGLLVVGATLAIFESNKRTYTTTDGLGQVQEDMRLTFEMMARDLREASNAPCGRRTGLQNVLNNRNEPTNAARAWWSPTFWFEGINGLENGARVGSTAGTDAIQMTYAGGEVHGVRAHDTASNTMTLTSALHDFSPGDVALVCDFNQAAIFQVTGPAARNDTIIHAQSAGITGNCTNNLDNDYLSPQVVDCTDTTAEYKYADATENRYGFVSKMQAAEWFVGPSAAGTSLYRSSLRNTGAADSDMEDQEIAPGVTDMEIEYLLPGGVNYVNATAVADWSRVQAARITLTINRNQGGNLIARSYTHTVAMRGRQ